MLRGALASCCLPPLGGLVTGRDLSGPVTGEGVAGDLLSRTLTGLPVCCSGED